MILLILLITAISSSLAALPQLNPIVDWKSLEYEFPSPQAKSNALKNGQYIPGNDIPIDLDIDYNKARNGVRHFHSFFERMHNRAAENGPRIFVTIPRFLDGVPMSLGTVTGQTGLGGQLIKPYPDYSWHASYGSDCNAITSVLRISIDKCNRLWVIDTGTINDRQPCPPKIMVFDLRSDRLLHKYVFPSDQYKFAQSLFGTSVVDVRDPAPRGTCTDTMVYIADITGYALIIYSLRENKSWRAENKRLENEPQYTTITVADESFTLQDGVLGIAASPHGKNRVLYFHPLTSISESSVPLRLLDDSGSWYRNHSGQSDSFTKIGNRGVQSAAETMDRNGNLFFGTMNPIAIACWDSSKKYNRDNLKVVVQNDKTLQFVAGLKVIFNKQGKEELWALSNRFQKYSGGTMTSNEVNYRIQAIQIDDLLDGKSKCSAVSRKSLSDYPPVY